MPPKNQDNNLGFSHKLARNFDRPPGLRSDPILTVQRLPPPPTCPPRAVSDAEPPTRGWRVQPRLQPALGKGQGGGSNTFQRLGRRRPSRSRGSSRQRAADGSRSEHVSARSLSMATTSRRDCGGWSRTESRRVCASRGGQLEQGCGRTSDHGTPPAMHSLFAYASNAVLSATCRTSDDASCSGKLW